MTRINVMTKIREQTLPFLFMDDFIKQIYLANVSDTTDMQHMVSS